MMAHSEQYSGRLVRAVWVSAALGLALAGLTLAGSASSAQPVNLALTAKATGSSEFAGGGFEAARANDGKLTTRWNDDCAEETPTLTLSWDSPVTLNLVVIRQAYDRIARFKLQAFDAARGSFTDVFEGTGPGSGRTDIDYTLRAVFTTPITTSQLRFVAVEKTSCVSIWEMEVYNATLGTATGKVTDDQGKPVAGATVLAGGISTTTDDSGRYSLLTEAGTVDLEVYKDPDYLPRWALGVVVPEGAAAQRDVILYPQPENLATGAEARVSSFVDEVDENGEPLYDPPKLIDNDLQTAWLSTEGKGATFGVDFGAPVTFNRVRIVEAGYSIAGLALQVLDPATGQFKTVAERTYSDRGSLFLQLTLEEPVTTEQMRLQVTDYKPEQEGQTVGIVELGVFNYPLALLRGVVVDAVTKALVPGAYVLTDGTYIAAMADNKGFFATQMDPDDYVLSAVADGYFASEGRVASLEVATPTDLTFELVPKGPDLALSAKASASGEGEGTTAAQAIDGNLDTYWAADALPAELTLTWDRDVTLDRILIQEYGDRSREISVQAWDATRLRFVEVGADVSPGSGADLEIEHTIDTAAPVTTSRLRILVPTADRPPRLREVEVYQVETAAAGPKGDTNGDGKVNVVDVVQVLRVILNLGEPTAAQRAASDVDHDGTPSIKDAILLLRFLVGVVTELP